jgi:DNA-binding PadR family transcriptional regulator
LSFSKTVVVRYRMHLEIRHLAPGHNQPPARRGPKVGIRGVRLRLLSADLAAGIRRVKGVKKLGVRLGNWLTAEQGQALWQAPDRERLRGNDPSTIRLRRHRDVFHCTMQRARLRPGLDITRRPCYYIRNGCTMGEREPLTPAVFHILLSLADGEKHGYGIMQEVAARTNDGLIMGPGTLYGTLKRMLEAGLVEECGERHDPAMDDQRRRYYRLTRQGGRAASAEAERLEALVRAARAKSLLRRPRRA